MGLDDAAPILCAGVTVYKALKQSNAKAGQWIAIRTLILLRLSTEEELETDHTYITAGAGGGLGHLCVQYANLMGLRVIAVDVSENAV